MALLFAPILLPLLCGPAASVGSAHCELATRLVKNGLPGPACEALLAGLCASPAPSGGAPGGPAPGPGLGAAGGGGAGGSCAWSDLTIPLITILIKEGLKPGAIGPGPAQIPGEGQRQDFAVLGQIRFNFGVATTVNNGSLF